MSTRIVLSLVVSFIALCVSIYLYFYTKGWVTQSGTVISVDCADSDMCMLKVDSFPNEMPMQKKYVPSVGKQVWVYVRLNDKNERTAYTLTNPADSVYLIKTTSAIVFVVFLVAALLMYVFRRKNRVNGASSVVA